MSEKIKNEKEILKRSKLLNFEESKRIKAIKIKEKKKELFDEINRNLEKSELAKNSQNIEKGLLRKSENVIIPKSDNDLFQKFVLRPEKSKENLIYQNQTDQAKRGLLKEQQKLQRILGRLTNG